MLTEPILASLAAPLAADPDVAALFLAGSHGNGTADAFSDIDLLAIAPAAAHRRVADAWRTGVERFVEVVFVGERHGRGVLLNVITADWMRIDLVVLAAADATGRCKAGLRPVFDRIGFHDGLPDDLPPAQPDPQRVGRTVNEFIRVLGLLPVGLGRGELVMCVKGADLLRDLLIDLMLEECPLPDRGGALHLGRLLRPQDMAVLEGLPYPQPRRQAVIDAHRALAAAFLPRARRLSAELGVAWPDRFEAATRRRLQEALGLDLGPSSRRADG